MINKDGRAAASTAKTINLNDTHDFDFQYNR